MAHHIKSVNQSKKDISMTLLSNAGGLFPACSGMNHSSVYVYYIKIQLRGQRVYLYAYLSVHYGLCMLASFFFCGVMCLFRS